MKRRQFLKALAAVIPAAIGAKFAFGGNSPQADDDAVIMGPAEYKKSLESGTWDQDTIIADDPWYEKTREKPLSFTVREHYGVGVTDHRAFAILRKQLKAVEKAEYASFDPNWIDLFGGKA